MTDRTLLTVLPGTVETQRVAVLLIQEGGGLELQHQSWGEGVGWYTQSTVSLDATQAALLRNTLGVSRTRSRSQRITENRPGLRICAESA